MFYCDECADKLGWRTKQFKGVGDWASCEVCGQPRACTEAPIGTTGKLEPDPDFPKWYQRYKKAGFSHEDVAHALFNQCRYSAVLLHQMDELKTERDDWKETAGRISDRDAKKFGEIEDLQAKLEEGLSRREAEGLLSLVYERLRDVDEKKHTEFCQFWGGLRDKLERLNEDKD
jgi:hypothetical protein